jgi:hypothetical protein
LEKKVLSPVKLVANIDFLCLFYSEASVCVHDEGNQNRSNTHRIKEHFPSLSRSMKSISELSTTVSCLTAVTSGDFLVGTTYKASHRSRSPVLPIVHGHFWSDEINLVATVLALVARKLELLEKKNPLAPRSEFSETNKSDPSVVGFGKHFLIMSRCCAA